MTNVRKELGAAMDGGLLAEISAAPPSPWLNVLKILDALPTKRLSGRRYYERLEDGSVCYCVIGAMCPTLVETLSNFDNKSSFGALQHPGIYEAGVATGLSRANLDYLQSYNDTCVAAWEEATGGPDLRELRYNRVRDFVIRHANGDVRKTEEIKQT
jgi:hypothetical protein